MKNLIMIAFGLALAVSASAAETYKLPKGSLSLSLAKGELVNVTTKAPNCPPNAICEAVSFARIKITLHGCEDSLGPVTYQTSHGENGKLQLHVTAYNVANRASMVTRCLLAPLAFVEIPLGIGFYSNDDIELSFESDMLVAR